MPTRDITKETQSQTSRASRARRLLSGIGVSREDSDDELGVEDYPWEWIYEDGSIERTNKKENELHESSSNDGAQAASPSQLAASGTKKRKADALTKPRIVAAQMGGFRCKLGDTVLLKAEGTNEAWVGLICEFQEAEEDDTKLANIMWFSTAHEIKNKQKKRTDFMENELYITPSWDVNPLASINGRATVTSAEVFLSKYPSGKVPRNSPDYGKIFVCQRGCNTRTATYTDEFIWEDIYKGREEDIYALIELVKSQTKATRRRRGVEGVEKSRSDPLIAPTADEDDLPQTPRKRRKLGSAATTPQSQRKARTPHQFTTPSRKRVVIKKALEFTPLGTRVLSPSHLTSSPFQVARTRLHVASVPAALPCRETEFSTVYSHLEAAISEGSGSCIYISGTPGTGKTATVREVVAQLNASVQAEELDDFVFVEINGMKVTDPHQAYSLLWEALRGDRVSPAHALDLLEREFSTPSPRRVPCVVLMDELDQLVTKNQSVMYNFFNWPGLRHSRLIVLAVANTMDLPERTLSNKISSRLGLTRITFPGYTHDQLMKIIQARLEGVPGDIVESDAIQFASRKVAAVSGDARRALDICRRAVEIAENQSLEEEDDDDETLPPTPSKTGRDKNRKGQGLAEGQQQRKGKVTIGTVKQAINEATTSPLQQHLRCLPLASKVFLAAVLARIRRTGVGECVLGDVIDEAKRIGTMANCPAVQKYLLETAGPLLRLEEVEGGGEGGAGQSSRQRCRSTRLQGMGSAAVELMEAGVIGLEARRGDRTGKVRLGVGEDEIKLALRDDVDVRDLGFAT